MTAPPSPHHHDILVLGAGFSGSAVAWHLLRAETRPSVVLVDASPTMHTGVAYSTADPEHRLNVPASRMSIDPANPSDFLDYARSKLGDATPTSLLPRPLYRTYLHDRFETALRDAPSRCTRLHGRATRLERRGNGWLAVLEDGTQIQANAAVLATGHGAPRLPPTVALLGDDPRLVRDPWRPGALAAIPEDDRVLLVGTGLTAIDVLITLFRRPRQATVHATSRGGRWPRPHLPGVA